ncbi:MAG TPA: hypothetical protein VFJ82_21380 [Longimicrobium sp.]|nr:hypothetical protein [Longimicrobium sp.]
MPKLTMDLDALRVDTFAVAAPAAKEVVAANAVAPSYPDPVYTCAYHCTWIGITCE